MDPAPLPAAPTRVGTSAILIAGTVVILSFFLAYAAAPALLGKLLSLLTSGFAQLVPLILGALLVGAVLTLLLWPPAWPRIRLAWGRFMRRLSFDAKAARDLRARLVDFENPSDLQALGRLYLDAGQAAASLPMLTRAVELEPDNARGAWLLGQAYVGIAQHEAATQAFDAAIARDPEIGFGNALLDRARTAARLDDATATKHFAEEHERRFGPCVENLWLQAEAARATGDAEARQETLARLLEIPVEKPSAQDALYRAKAKMAYRGGRAT